MYFKFLGKAMSEKKQNWIFLYIVFFGIPAKTFVDFEPRNFQRDRQISKRNVRDIALRRNFFLYKNFPICNLFRHWVKVLGRVVKSAFFSSDWKIFFVKIARKFLLVLLKNFIRVIKTALDLSRENKWQNKIEGHFQFWKN